MTWQNVHNVVKLVLALLIFGFVWDLIFDTRGLIDGLPGDADGSQALAERIEQQMALLDKILSWQVVSGLGLLVGGDAGSKLIRAWKHGT